MTQFLEYIFDISESYQTGIIKDKLKDAGYKMDIYKKDPNDPYSIEKIYICSGSSDDSNINIALKDENDNKITLKYFTDDLDEYDMMFFITHDDITLHFNGEVHNDITKDVYFNLTMCFSKTIIDFDYIKDIQSHFNELTKFTLFYVQNEETEYGYV